VLHIISIYHTLVLHIISIYHTPVLHIISTLFHFIRLYMSVCPEYVSIMDYHGTLYISPEGVKYQEQKDYEITVLVT
jgi:hypothetical protein